MRISRLTAGLVTAGLVGFVPLAVTAPAQAAAVNSTTTLSISNTLPVEYGDELFLSGSVTGTPSPSFTGGGTASLQILTPGAAAYVTIATDTTPSSFLDFGDVIATTNAQYKVVYSGGASSTSGTTLNASESAPVAVTVKRKITLKTNGLKVIGKVTPFAKEKVKIKRKDGKKYKQFATVKTNKKGKFVFRAPNKVGFRFIVIIPANAQFVGTADPYRVI